MKIWKFPIEITDRFTLSVPFQAEIIHVGLDPSGTACIWAMCEPRNTRENIDLYLVGTGHDIPDEAVKHWGSFVQGPFVWHLFSR